MPPQLKNGIEALLLKGWFQFWKWWKPAPHISTFWISICEFLTFQFSVVFSCRFLLYFPPSLFHVILNWFSFHLLLQPTFHLAHLYQWSKVQGIGPFPYPYSTLNFSRKFLWLRSLHIKPLTCAGLNIPKRRPLLLFSLLEIAVASLSKEVVLQAVCETKDTLAGLVLGGQCYVADSSCKELDERCGTDCEGFLCGIHQVPEVSRDGLSEPSSSILENEGSREETTSQAREARWNTDQNQAGLSKEAC